MNTGLQDVWNLVWKLDLTLRAHGSERLLDSYTAERRPVIQHVVRTTDLMTKALGTPSRLAQSLRNRIIPRLSRLAAFQHRFVQNLSQIGIAYGGSPVVEGAGKRYFDESLGGGKAISSRFLLLVPNDSDASSLEPARQLCDRLSDLVELRQVQNKGVTLLRPDGYMAYETDGRDGARTIEAIRRVLARHVQPAR